MVKLSTPDDGGAGPGDWAEYRRLVLTTLKRIDADLAEIHQQIEARDKASIARWEALDLHMRNEVKAMESKRLLAIDAADHRYVTRGEFAPVRALVYGAVGLICTIILGLLVATIVR
jgi:hypothetical protein